MKFNKLIPELSVSDIKRSKSFYTEVLGFRMEYERVEDRFVFVSLDGAQIMLEERNGHWETGELEYPFGRGINFQIEIKDIDSFVSRIKQKGIVPFKDVFGSSYKCGDICYEEKEILIQDPDGYLLRFSETVETSGIDLAGNVDKLCCTDLGIERIRKNLGLENTDVVAWCREKILDKRALIERKGKNYYVTIDGVVITVNAGSFTIITAHKDKR